MRTQSETPDLVPGGPEEAKLIHQLQENQERLQLIQQAANIGIFDWDIQTGLVNWSIEAEQLFGLQPGSFGKTLAAWEECVHPEDLPEARRQVFESIDRKTNLDVQFRVIWPDDQSIHWIYAKARTFYDEQGNPLRMLGINIDITDRKKYEEDLRIKTKELQLFIESDIIGLIIADIHGSVSYANDAFLRITGCSRRDIEDGSVRWTDIAPPGMSGCDQCKPGEARQNSEPVFYERQCIHRNGTVIDVFIGFLVFDEQREQAVAFVLDVTKRKRLERQKDEFIGIVSHELRTPVTSLKVFAQLLQKRFKNSGDSQNAALLLKMGTQIDKLTKLIADLIDVTKLEAGKLQLYEAEFDLQSLIEEVIEEMQRTTTHTIVSKGVIERTIWGDRDRIGQVLTNLLSNAIKYSPRADTILVKISADDEQVTVSVQDFGMGIPLAKQKQIFQRFYRADEEDFETIPGLGLGLYISAEIIKQQGGSMGVESTPGRGSTFFFCIPLQKKGTYQLRENGGMNEPENCDC